MAPLILFFFVDEKNLVENGLQKIPLAGTADLLEPGDLLGTSPCPLLGVPVASVLYDDDSASASTLGVPDDPHHVRPGPCDATPAGLSPPRRPVRTPLSCRSRAAHRRDGSSR